MPCSAASARWPGATRTGPDDGAIDPAAQWLRGFVPARPAVSRREVLVSGLGAGLGLFIAFALSRWALGTGQPLVRRAHGRLGGAAVRGAFEPARQPWSLVGGNLVAALIGVSCARWIPDAALAASVAGGLAIATMFALRCLHPPSGAVALTAVLGGPAVTKLGYGFVFTPVLVDSLALLAAALAFNAALRRRYPHGATLHPHPHLTRDEPPSARLGPTAGDVDAVLAQRGELLDISPSDVEELVAQAERRAYVPPLRRRALRGHHVARRGDGAPDMSSQHAWSLMRRHAVKALPVVDGEGNGTLVGIVTMHDFFIGGAAAGDAGRDGADTPVRRMMTTAVITARPEQPIVELITLFSDGGRHHLPVIDALHRLVGMVAQSDMVAALYRMGLERRV